MNCVCGYSGKYKTFQDRPNAQCPDCGSLERHRVAYQHLAFFKYTNILHIAPEPIIEKLLRKKGEYTSCGLDSGDDKVDITKMPYTDNQFDFVFCSHVLEHIENDTAAISEINRVLNGEAVIFVPIIGHKTYQDDSFNTPELREKAYGQFDHVRIYGMDIVDRFEATGFKVEVIEHPAMPEPFFHLTSEKQ